MNIHHTFQSKYTLIHATAEHKYRQCELRGPMPRHVTNIPIRARIDESALVGGQGKINGFASWVGCSAFIFLVAYIFLSSHYQDVPPAAPRRTPGKSHCSKCRKPFIETAMILIYWILEFWIKFAYHGLRGSRTISRGSRDWRWNPLSRLLRLYPQWWGFIQINIFEICLVMDDDSWGTQSWFEHDTT